MGGNESKNPKKMSGSSATVTNPPKGKIPKNTQHVLLLYKAKSKAQRDIMDAFQDALEMAADGKVEIEYDINMADIQGEVASSIKDVAWLNKPNNVILIRLSPDLISDIERIIKEKKFVEKDGILHGSIITVSFEKAVDFSKELPNNGIRRLENDCKKDFCFEFGDENLLTSKDFKTPSAKSTMYSILDALKS